MRPFPRLAAATLAGLMSLAVQAQSLYAVSLRTYTDPGHKGVEGNIYVVDTESAATRLVASLNVRGKTPIGLDGLAIHPKTGVFYGITAPGSSVLPRSLVTVDPASGDVNPVGDLGYVGSDIGFAADSTLYMWLPETRQLATVNIDTGAATPRGQASTRGASKGGLALVGVGRAYIADTGAQGTLDSIDLATGAITQGPALTGATFPHLINGLAYSAKGVLYGINTNSSHPSLANLVTIDARTGAVTHIGALPNDSDAITFGSSHLDGKGIGENMMLWRMPLLVVLFLFAIVFTVVALRSRKG